MAREGHDGQRAHRVTGTYNRLEGISRWQQPLSRDLSAPALQRAQARCPDARRGVPGGCTGSYRCRPEARCLSLMRVSVELPDPPRIEPLLQSLNEQYTEVMRRLLQLHSD